MLVSDLYRLARAARAVALAATAADGPVTAGEVAVYEDLARHPGSTVGDVTARTGLAQSLVSRLVAAGAKEGALDVVPDDRDRRKVRVTLTPPARTGMADSAARTVDAALADATPALGDEERARLLDHLVRAAELLDRGAGRGPAVRAEG